MSSSRTRRGVSPKRRCRSRRRADTTAMRTRNEQLSPMTRGPGCSHKQCRGHSCIIVIMADTWFTSDFHLGHFNIIRYCNRPFADTREMDEVIVDRLNGLVKPNDTLYFLGDFCLGKHDSVAAYRNRLACQTIHFIDGNHDKTTRQLQHPFSSWSSLSEIRSEERRVWKEGR